MQLPTLRQLLATGHTASYDRDTLSVTITATEASCAHTFNDEETARCHEHLPSMLRVLYREGVCKAPQDLMNCLRLSVAHWETPGPLWEGDRQTGPVHIADVFSISSTDDAFNYRTRCRVYMANTDLFAYGVVTYLPQYVTKTVPAHVLEKLRPGFASSVLAAEALGLDKQEVADLVFSDTTEPSPESLPHDMLMEESKAN